MTINDIDCNSITFNRSFLLSMDRSNSKSSNKPPRRRRGKAQNRGNQPVLQRQLTPQIEVVDSHGMCIRRGFTVVPNDGVVSNRNERYTSSCFFKSVADYLRIKRPDISAIRLRNCVKFPKVSIEVDTFVHRAYIQSVCDLFKISIAFFTVNTDQDNNHAYWIGNPALVFTPVTQCESRISIASYGGHYELIVSQTVFSSDIREMFVSRGIRLHEFKYNFPVLRRYMSEDSDLARAISVSRREDLERKLRDAQLSCEKHMQLVQLLTQELVELMEDTDSDSSMVRTKSLQEMIANALKCCSELETIVQNIRQQL
jgi:hypothetical protein